MKGRSRGQAKRAQRRSANVAVNSARPDVLVPTLEYLAQEHGPKRGQQGGYRVIDALERLFNRHLLDADKEDMNEAMYLAALKLRDLFRKAGLEGSLVGSIEMDRIIGGRSDPPWMMAVTESMVDAKREYAYALEKMGYYGEPGDPEYAPFRGSGRVVDAVVCRGSSVEEAARTHTGASGERANAEAMCKLRDGLVALVSWWRLAGRGDNSRGAVKAFRGFQEGDLAW